jgi:hypothetical protein
LSREDPVSVDSPASSSDCDSQISDVSTVICVDVDDAKKRHENDAEKRHEKVFYFDSEKVTLKTVVKQEEGSLLQGRRGSKLN